MRTLSRPMFNMGGPIKQGVMQGIREPYKQGSIVGGHQSPALAGAHPIKDASGREHHVLPAMAAWTGVRAALPWVARMGARYLKPLFGTTTPGSVTRGAKVGKKAWKKLRKTDPNIGGPFQNVKITPDKFNPNWLGRDPIVQSGAWLGKSIFNPTAGGLAQKAARFALSPSTLTIGGLYYANGRWFNKKGEELDPKSTEVVKAKAGSKDYGPYTKGKRTLTAAQIDAKAKADKEKRINALLDTMGYDKARKDAAYNALIDAGRLISERGSLKGKNIGRELIDPIVAATSARFDKPQQIREAVGLMKVKADIAKQLEDPQIKALRALEIEKGEKALAGDTLEETITAGYGRHGGFPTGDKLAQLARNKGIEITDVVDTSKDATGLDDIGDPVEFMEGKVKELRDAGTEVPPGLYIVEDSIILIDAQGNVKRRPVT